MSMASDQARRAALAHLAHFDGLGSDDIDRALDAAAPYLLDVKVDDPRAGGGEVDRWAAADAALRQLTQEAYRHGLEDGSGGIVPITGAPVYAERDKALAAFPVDQLLLDEARGAGYAEAIELHRDQLDMAAGILDMSAKAIDGDLGDLFGRLATRADLSVEHGVPRAAVNAWRKDDAFPAPLGQLGGQDIYDRRAVAAWYVATVDKRTVDLAPAVNAIVAEQQAARADPLAAYSFDIPAQREPATLSRPGEVMMGAAVDGTGIGVDLDDEEDDGRDFDVDMGAAPGATASADADVWGPDDDD